MKNYNEILAKITKIEEVKKVVAEINNNIQDNNKNFEFNFANLQTVVDDINKKNREIFSKSFVALALSNRKVAFADLLEKPYYNTFTAIFDKKSGLYDVKDSTRLFTFTDLEKAYRAEKSEKDSQGNPIIDKSITIFDATRFYGLASVFIRNLQKANFEIDEANGFKLENVVVDGEKIFKDIDGKIFESNSNNALEKQLNILVGFFGYDVKMLKKDLPILKLKAQKLKQDRKTAQFSVNAVIDDNSILKFADVVFGVIANRIKGLDTEIITSKPTKKAE